MQDASSRNNSSCVDISIFLDRYPVDTSWSIVVYGANSTIDNGDNITGTVVATSPAYDASMAFTEQTERVCLTAQETYSFVINDVYEDGICCDWGKGNYTLTSVSSGNVLATGGAWTGPSETTTFSLAVTSTTSANATTTTTTTTTTSPPIAPSPLPTINNNDITPTAENITDVTTPIINNTAVPTVENITNITTQVSIYLTGVPNNDNNDHDMTNEELFVFETLLYTLLHSRLETVDVNILDVVVDSQINNPRFDAESPFETSQIIIANSNNNGESREEELSVLQIITNITLSYTPPPPEGWRDWSIYLTSWIQSFGTTMVDILTDPKNDLYPNEKYFDAITDVSATNINPPDTDPTASPTLSPTYLGAPEYKKPLANGLASTGVIVIVLFFLGALWCKRRRLMMARSHNSQEPQMKMILADDDDYDDNEGDGDGEIPSQAQRGNEGDARSGSERRNDDNYSDDNVSADMPPSRLEQTTMPPFAPYRDYQQEEDFAQYDRIVANVMANNPKLTQIMLDNKRQIGHNDEGEALWQALTRNKYVKLLSLRNSNITDDNIAALALALSENTAVSHLLLNNNKITSASVEYLIVCLECNSTIKVLDLGGNSLISPNIHDELKGLLQSRQDRDDGDDSGLKRHKLLARVQGNDPRLTELDLHDMDIGPNTISIISDALAENSHLRFVNLSSNMIDDDCVSALSLALAENTSISHLSLANNRITSIGAEYLLCSLENNSAILDVDLKGNSIDEEILAELNFSLKLRRRGSSH